MNYKIPETKGTTQIKLCDAPVGATFRHFRVWYTVQEPNKFGHNVFYSGEDNKGKARKKTLRLEGNLDIVVDKAQLEQLRTAP